MPRPILCIGGATVDLTYLCTAAPTQGTSNPVTSRRSFGGVARNVAESLARLGASVRLVSAIGEDAAGRSLSAALAASGADARGLLTVPALPTAQYTAAFWGGELFAGFADMNIFDCLTPAAIRPHLQILEPNSIIFADCNLPPESLAMLCAHAQSVSVALALDAVSLSKSGKLPVPLTGVHVLFLNAAQARHMADAEVLPVAIERLHARGAGAIVLTEGRQGVCVSQSSGTARLPAPMVPVTNVSGAGDAIIAGTLLGLSEDRDLTDAVKYGLAAAALALQTIETVPPTLTRERLDTMLAANQGIPNAY